MRLFIFISALSSFLFFSACNNNSGRNDDDERDREDTAVAEPSTLSIANEFPELFNFISSQDSSVKNSVLEAQPFDQNDSVRTKIDEEQTRGFKPYFIYNSDSSLAIDIVSYNFVVTAKRGKTVFETAGPDTEASLLDIRKGIKKRLFFFGPSVMILDAKWKDADKLLIAIAEQQEHGNNEVSVLEYEVSTGESNSYGPVPVVAGGLEDWLLNKLNGVKTNLAF